MVDEFDMNDYKPHVIEEMKRRYQETMRKEFTDWLKSEDYIIWKHDVMNCYSSDEDLFQMAIQHAFEKGMDYRNYNT